MKTTEIPMIDLIGKEYRQVMECKKRYLVLKGSRASKKSKNTAIRFILMLYEYPKSNLLVIRKYLTLLRQSARADLIWAIRRIGVESDWEIPKSEMTLKRKSTGQVILFRGANEPEGIASITVSEGVLNFCWIEEAYQIEREVDFNLIDESIRGEMPEGYFKQIVVTFNPWHESSWLRERFFVHHLGEELDSNLIYIEGKQKSTPQVLALTRNYLCNEWLDKTDLDNFERMKIEQPARYLVAGLGEWGVSGSTIYTNYEVKEFSWLEKLYQKDRETGIPIYESRIGLDFGYSHNTAGVRLLVDRANREIYICQELYASRLSTDEIYQRIVGLGWEKEPIHADSEDPKTIKDLQKLGCSRIFGVKKERGSVTSGIQELRGYKIIIHPTCEAFEIEISHYAFKQDAKGKELPQPIKEWDHLMDAMRYAMKDDSAGIEFIGTQKPIVPKESRTAYEEKLARVMFRRR